jgi:hypothetical protein
LEEEKTKLGFSLAMLGTGLQFGGRGRGEDRFYNSAKARRAQQNQRAEQLRRAQSDVTPSPSSSSSSVKETTVQREPDNHVDRVSFGEPQKPIAMPVIEPVSPLSNLERFVQSITPSVPTQYPSKTTMKGWSGEVESRPFFVLGDLWESFKEWSAYGAGVPLVLNDSDCVIQYYVPYLSGIQIYGDSAKLSVKQRRPDEDSDSDFRDSSSDGSSDCETERLKYMREQHSQHNLSSDVSRRIDRLSLRDHPSSLQDDFSSDDGESAISQSCLIFEYLERDPPYSRVPLADKLADLAFRLPELKSLRSCDLLRSSWISVAWYCQHC